MSDATITDIRSLREQVKGRICATPRIAPSSEEQVLDALKSKEFADELQRCVPSGIKYDVSRLTRVVQTLIRGSAQLASAEPRSILGATMECAEMGLMPGFMGHVYIAARLKAEESGGFQYEAEVIPGYRGLIALAMRSGDIKSVTARLVTDEEIKGGLFDLYYEGEKDLLLHRPILIGNKGRPVLAYCLVRFTDGSFHVEPMDEGEILAIKAQALASHPHAGRKSAWNTNENEMWRKTPVRRAFKYLNIMVDGMERAVQLDDQSFKGESQQLHRRYGTEGEAAIAAAKESAAAQVAQPEGNEKPLQNLFDPDSPEAGQTL